MNERQIVVLIVVVGWSSGSGLPVGYNEGRTKQASLVGSQYVSVDTAPGHSVRDGHRISSHM
jgi:hypothetical protein